MNKLALKFALIALFICLGVSSSWAQTGANRVFTAEIKGKKFRTNLANSKPLQFSIRTPEGNYSFTLQSREPFTPKRFRNGQHSNRPSLDIRLYQGYVSFRDQERAAAADLIGETLRVRFMGFNSNRLYVAKVDKNTLEGRLIHAPMSAAFGCGIETESTNHSHRESLRNASTVRIFNPEVVLSIKTDADYEMYDSYGQDEDQTNSEIQAMLNAAEAFYTDQIGLRFDLLEQNVYTDQGTQPVTSTDATTLIISYKDELLANSAIGSSNAFHLFTGKDMDGGTIGIAYLPGICQPSSEDPLAYPVGVTQKVNEAIQAIVLAHEIGHNLGAEHDRADGSSIMYPFVSAGNEEFSTFSVNQITEYINESGSCLEGWQPGATASPTPTPEPTATPTPLPQPSPTPEIENNKPVAVILNASVKSRKNYKFTAVINTDSSRTDCKTTLLASSKRRHITNNLSTFNTELANLEQALILKAYEGRFKMAKKDRRRRKVFFKTLVTCGSNTYESNTVIVKVRVPNKKGILKKFFQKLKLSLS